MLSETNLDGVKSVAHALLMTDIHKTELSPISVQHPFTNSGMVAVKNDDVIQLVDVTVSEENLCAWHEYMTELINNAEKPYLIYMMTNKPYGLTFLRYASTYLSREDFSEILADAWIRSENPNSDPNLTKSQLLRMFLSADPNVLMSPEEREQLHSLENPVTVYRGVTSHNTAVGRALSWTLNRDTALWFANRFGEIGYLYEAQVDKEKIIALLNGRNESEIIIEPRYLMNLSFVSAEKQEVKLMTRLQQEVSRRCYSLGCKAEYNNQDGSMQIIYDGANICRLHSDDSYTYKDGEHQTEEQKNMFLKVENLIDNCKEYITAYDKSQPFAIDGISDYRKLSEFNGVVLGAKDMGEHGFQFSSWFLTYGGSGATMGDYSFDYDYSKQSFAERSGLVDKARQFSNEQLENLYRCLAFTRENNDTLSYDQDKALGSLIERIEGILPYVEDNPDYTFGESNDAPQMKM